VTGAATTAAAESQRHRTSRRGAIEEWLQIPDVYVSWIVPAVLLGRRLLREQRFDAIFSSYPRGSAHLVAAELAKVRIPLTLDTDSAHKPITCSG
jgi:hypothetical protein